MANDYFDSADFTALTRVTLARAEAVNAILDAIVVGFDQLPAARELKEGRVTYADDVSVAANTILLTLPYPPEDYQEGLLVFWTNAIAITSASAINVNSLGIKTLKRYNGTDTESGDLPLGAIGVALYDGTNFQLLWPVGSILAAATAQAAAAAASATAAAASATSSASSATSSATSATSSASSATSAAASAVLAAAAAGSSGRFWLGTPGGSGDAMTTTVDLPSAAWVDGYLIEFIAPGTNTVAGVTIEATAEGVPATSIKDQDGNALAVGAIVSGRRYSATYRSTGTAFRLHNPSVSQTIAEAGTANVGEMTPLRVAQAIAALVQVDLEVDPVIKTGNFNAVSGYLYMVNTAGGAITATLDASPTQGQRVGFIDATGTFGTNNLTLGRNGRTIDGSAANFVLNMSRIGHVLDYNATAGDWRVS